MRTLQIGISDRYFTVDGKKPKNNKIILQEGEQYKFVYSSIPSTSFFPERNFTFKDYDNNLIDYVDEIDNDYLLTVPVNTTSKTVFMNTSNDNMISLELNIENVTLDYMKYNTETLLPRHINSLYPDFVKFMKDYFDYMGGRLFPKDIMRNIVKYRDIDTSSEEFFDSFYYETLDMFPRNILADKNILVKNISDFYNKTGTKKSFEFLLRIIFNEKNSSVWYPKKLTLQPSTTTQSTLNAHFPLQDNLLWETFSFVIDSKLNLSQYDQYVSDLVQVAGTNLYGRVVLDDNPIVLNNSSMVDISEFMAGLDNGDYSIVASDQGEWFTEYDITAINKKNHAIINITGPHDIQNGDRVYVSDVVGMTEINSVNAIAVNVSTDNVSLLNIDSTDFSDYISGGKLKLKHEKTPNTDFQSSYLTDWRFIKQLHPYQYSYVYPRTDWISDTAYSVNNVILTDDMNIYRCVTVGSGNSTDKPTHTSGNVTESDGYEWSYNETLDDTTLNFRFLTDEYTPVNISPIGKYVIATLKIMINCTFDHIQDCDIRTIAVGQNVGEIKKYDVTQNENNETLTYTNIDIYQNYSKIDRDKNQIEQIKWVIGI